MTREYPKEYAEGGSGLQSSGAIPEVWSGKPVNKSYAKTVRGVMANTDYSKAIRRKKKKKIK